MTSGQDVLECLRPTFRRVQGVDIGKLLGAVLTRARKREVNKTYRRSTHVSWSHPKSLHPIQMRYLLLVHLSPEARWTMGEVWYYMRDTLCSKAG